MSQHFHSGARQRMLVHPCIPSVWCLESALLSVQHEDSTLPFCNSRPCSNTGLAYKLQVDSPLGASAVAGEPAARKQKSSPKDGSSFLAQQSQGMQRPQARFKDAADNSNRPFIHNFEHVQQWQVISSTCGSGWCMQMRERTMLCLLEHSCS